MEHHGAVGSSLRPGVAAGSWPRCLAARRYHAFARLGHGPLPQAAAGARILGRRRAAADRPRQPGRRVALRRPRPLDHPAIGGPNRPAAADRSDGACDRWTTNSLLLWGRAEWGPARPRRAPV